MAQTLAEFNAATLLKWTAARLRVDVKVNLFIANTLKKVVLTVAQRVRIAGQFLQDKVKINLSRPVRKFRVRRTVTDEAGAKKVKTRTIVDRFSRSKPGEFPRADTTQLMKTIFLVSEPDAAGGPRAMVGTPLHYGLILETKLDRSFLRRTLNELRAQLLLILQGGGTVGGVS